MTVSTKYRNREINTALKYLVPGSSTGGLDGCMDIWMAAWISGWLAGWMTPDSQHDMARPLETANS